MNPENFNRIGYLCLIDSIPLRDKESKQQAELVGLILEQFIDPLLQPYGPLYADEDYVNDPLPHQVMNDFGISSRQFACRENILRNLESQNLIDAYYELIDYLLDCNDAHNNRMYRNEINALNEPYEQIKSLAKQIRE